MNRDLCSTKLFASIIGIFLFILEFSAVAAPKYCELALAQSVSHFIVNAKILPVSEQAALIQKYKNTSNPEIRNRIEKQLLESNVKILAKITAHWHKKNIQLSFSDMFQQGSLGLQPALNKFNPQKKTSFPTYVRRWFEAYVIRYVVAELMAYRKDVSMILLREYFMTVGRLRRRLEQQKIADNIENLTFEFNRFQRLERPNPLKANIHDIEQAEMSIRDFRNQASADEAIGEFSEEGQTHVNYTPSTALDDLGFSGSYYHFAQDDVVQINQRQEQYEQLFASFRDTLDAEETVIFDTRILVDAEDRVPMNDVIQNHFRGKTRQQLERVERRVRAELKQFLIRNNAQALLRD